MDAEAIGDITPLSVNEIAAQHPIHEEVYVGLHILFTDQKLALFQVAHMYKRKQPLIQFIILQKQCIAQEFQDRHFQIPLCLIHIIIIIESFSASIII